MPANFAGAGVGQNFARHAAQAERVVEFSIGVQGSVGVTTEPRSCSFKRRSKSSLRASPSDSPAWLGVAALLERS